MRRTLCALAAAACAGAAHAATLAANLADLSLEQLSNIVVSTVSGREEPLSSAPASIYVITGNDIRRSGALSLPEALRLAPNLQVARVDANQWAISARGFNNVLANRLLILIDGRTVYTPLFAGTFWEAQDVLLEDVERIEVISGPGATLWGANAVNGVINVITKSAAATQGALVSLGAGDDQRDIAARYGGEAGGIHYRVYAKARDRDGLRLPGGASIADASRFAQGGFRADWQRSGDAFTLQADLHDGDIDAGRDFAAANVLGRWTRALGEGASLRTQAYFERTTRDHHRTFRETLDTYDLDLQHNLRRMGRHRLVWGFGLRYYRDRVQNFPEAGLAFLPAHRDLERHHLFVQDEIALTPTLDLTLGAKLESNSYTGTEFLPNVRLAWRATPTQFFWGALSRAVRAPSRIDREFFTPAVAGGPAFRSEVSDVLEIGYRAQPAPRLSLSVTGFLHEHERLASVLVPPVPATFTNQRDGRTSGVEAWASWRPRDWARFDAGIVRLHQALRIPPGTVDLAAGLFERDPRQWWKLRAAFDLGERTDLDVMVRHYGALPNNVPDYTALDLRLGWRAMRNVELSLLVQNLLDRGHVEWSPGAELERTAYIKLRIDL